MYTLRVLSPEAADQGSDGMSRPASRPASLEGLSVGLVWNMKRGGREALTRAGELLSSRYRGVTVRLYEGGQPCNRQLLETAARESDIFIGSTGD